MNNNYKTVKELLQEMDQRQNIKPVKVRKFNTKNKKFAISVAAITAAGVIVATSSIVGLINYFKKNNNNNNFPLTPNTSNSTMDISDIGTELEFPKEKNNSSKYENPTGKVDVNKIVEKNNKIYVDKDNADKSNTVGTSSIDTKNDTLIVEDGKVKEKTEGYEIKDDKGNVVQEGNLDQSGIPENFEKNEELDGFFEKEDNTSTLTYSDSDYYDENGDLALAKGDLVEKERLEYAKKHYSTTKPVISSISSTTNNTSSKTETSSTVSSTTNNTSSKTETSSTTTTSNEGKVNADGTYTIFGVTYADKATFEQIALSDLETLDMYLDENGVLHIKTEELENQLTKTK